MPRKAVRNYSMIRTATLALLAIVAAIVLLPPVMDPVATRIRAYCSTRQQYTAPTGGIIRRHDLGFVDELGNAFRPFGSSFYWAREYSSYGISELRVVRKAFDLARALGMNVVRIWAYADGQTNNIVPLQPQPGVYNEVGFLGLDLAVAEAAQRGLRVLLTFTDYWSFYGGFPTYARWAQSYSQANVSTVDDVFTCEICRKWMKEYMTHVLSRINRFTGETYASDPRIFAYEVMNEPRNKNGRNDNSVARWLQEMASHFRTLDTQHMLTVGLDGFFSSSTPELQAYNPYNGAELEGIDFLNIAKIPEFDFIGIHAHVDEWLTDGHSLEQKANFMRDWLRSHNDLMMKQVHKPLMLGEFSKARPQEERDLIFDTAFKEIEHAAAHYGALMGGDLIWTLSIPAYDCGALHNFSICPSEETSMALIKRHAQRLQESA